MAVGDLPQDPVAVQRIRGLTGVKPLDSYAALAGAVGTREGFRPCLFSRGDVLINPGAEIGQVGVEGNKAKDQQLDHAETPQEQVTPGCLDGTPDGQARGCEQHGQDRQGIVEHIGPAWSMRRGGTSQPSKYSCGRCRPGSCGCGSATTPVTRSAKCRLGSAEAGVGSPKTVWRSAPGSMIRTSPEPRSMKTTARSEARAA